MAGKNTILDKLTVLSALAAACLALSGCFRIETDTVYTPIGFRSYAATSGSEELASRADGSFIAPGRTVLPDSSSFGVFAFYQEGVIGSGTPAVWTDGGWKPEYMFNQKVDFDGAAYDYDPLRYWPANDENRISFWAYYPYEAYAADNSGDLKFFESDGTTPYSKSSVGLPKAGYTVSTDPALQRDLLFDSFTNTDKTYDNCSPTPGTVPMKFRHALALVEFQIAEGNEANVTNFEITGLYWSGKCADVSASPLVWTDQSSVAPYTVSGLSVTDGTVCSLLMIPQTLSASARLSINFDILYPSAVPELYPDPITYSGNTGSELLSAAGIPAWEAGHHYIYKIRAGFERIEFEEVVDSTDDWTVGNDNIAVSD